MSSVLLSDRTTPFFFDEKPDCSHFPALDTVFTRHPACCFSNHSLRVVIFCMPFDRTESDFVPPFAPWFFPALPGYSRDCFFQMSPAFLNPGKFFSPLGSMERHCFQSWRQFKTFSSLFLPLFQCNSPWGLSGPSFTGPSRPLFVFRSSFNRSLTSFLVPGGVSQIGHFQCFSIVLFASHVCNSTTS